MRRIRADLDVDGRQPADAWPAWSRIAASSRVVTVLPSVPVTPTSAARARDGRGPRPRRSASAARAAGPISTAATRGCVGQRRLADDPTAPRSTPLGRRRGRRGARPGSRRTGHRRRPDASRGRRRARSVAGSPWIRRASGTSCAGRADAIGVGTGGRIIECVQCVSRGQTVDRPLSTPRPRWRVAVK